ncbi:aminoglycoside adenylyltransferase domain-containing protein [Dictyobacter alpinus]|nr:aminoglycoside adenylyltransferase domain-containing protein [Dictyobacter alpinus]
MLTTNLIGIYLHGSLAMGCFNPERSDIDLLVAVQHTLSVFVKRQLITLLLESSQQPHPIEISFLNNEQLNPYQHPVPFDLHYSESWREHYQTELINNTWQRWNDRQATDTDLDAHLTILRNRGITLYGQEYQITFPVIPSNYYVESILNDYYGERAEKQHNSVYFILNACRIHAYLQARHIYSKDEGGIYGLTTFPVQFIHPITQALDIYRGRIPARPFEDAILDTFADYMDNYIQAWQQA